MNATFYKFSKRANSTLRPSSGGTTKSIRLKDGTSILFPTIMLKQDTRMDFNYCYIPDLGNRYYWVTDCYNDHKFVYYNLRVDVLASLWGSLQDTTQYVSRSATRANSWIKDTFYPETLKKEFDAHKFVGSESPFGDALQNDTGTYVVGTINGRTDDSAPQQVGGITYYFLNSTEIRTLMNYLIGDYSYLDDNAGFGITKAIIKEITNPISSIVTCYWLPFPKSVYTRNYVDSGKMVCSRFIMGTGDNYTVAKSAIKNSLALVYEQSYTMGHHPQYSSHGAYMDTYPFTERILRTGPWGDIALDTDELVYRSGNNIYMRIESDFMGNAILRITSGVDDDGVLLYQGQANISVPFRLNYINDDRIGLAKKEINQAGSGINMAANLLAPGLGGGIGRTFNAGSNNASSSVANWGQSAGNALSMMAGKDKVSHSYSTSQSLFSGGSFSENSYGGSSYNSRAAAGDIGSIGGSTASYASSCVDTATHTPKTTSLGSSGSFMTLRKTWELDSYYTYATDNMVNVVGRPLCEFVRLGDLTGFCKLLNPNLSAIAATITELEMAKNQLEDGFFIEA